MKIKRLFSKFFIVVFLMGLVISVLFASAVMPAQAQEKLYRLNVYPDTSKIYSSGWTAGLALQIWKNHAKVGDGWTDSYGVLNWENTSVEFKAGDLVEVTAAGIVTLAHTVFDFTIDTHPTEVNAIGGHVTAITPLNLGVYVTDGVTADYKYAQVLPGGLWIASDFLIPLRPGISITVSQQDANGYYTIKNPQVSSAKFDVYPDRNYIEGWGMKMALNPPNENVILDSPVLKDIVIPVGATGDFRYGSTVPNSFPRGGTVTLSVNFMSMKLPLKSMTVDLRLAVSGFDLPSKTLSGVGTPGTFVVLQLPVGTKITYVDTLGKWSFDLSTMAVPDWNNLVGRVFVGNANDDYTAVNFQFSSTFLPLITKYSTN